MSACSKYGWSESAAEAMAIKFGLVLLRLFPTTPPPSVVSAAVPGDDGRWELRDSDTLMKLERKRFRNVCLFSAVVCIFGFYF